MLRRCLFLLLVLRLLWPPGICVCHLFDPEPAHHHDHDDHVPGCPASKMAMTSCAMKPDVPRPPDLPEPVRLSADDGAEVDGALRPCGARSPADPDPPERSLYLTLRALLI